MWLHLLEISQVNLTWSDHASSISDIDVPACASPAGPPITSLDSDPCSIRVSSVARGSLASLLSGASVRSVAKEQARASVSHFLAKPRVRPLPTELQIGNLLPARSQSIEESRLVLRERRSSPATATERPPIPVSAQPIALTTLPQPRDQPVSDSLCVLLVATQLVPKGLVFQGGSHDQEQVRQDGGDQCPE